MDESNKFLGTEKVSKLLVKFSLPCILSLVISSLYNIVDQIFIGNSALGYLGNAATSVVYPITIIAVAFAWALADGSAAFLSLSQGRKDTKDAPIGIANSILVSLIISIILLVVFFLFRDNILYLFGASDASIGYARTYFNIIVAAFPAYMFANCLNSVIRADGSPKYSMACTLTGAIINIILDPIFIFGCKWGMAGAAWATIIGQIASAILSLIYLFRTKTFKLKVSDFKLNLGIFSNVIKLGVSTFITQASIVVISLVCNMTLAKYGALSKYGADIPIAVIGIAMKVFTIVINIVCGIVVGAQPIFGYNFGAKKYKRVRDTFKLVIISNLIVGIIADLIFVIHPQGIISLFGTNSELYMEFAVKTFRIFLLLVVCTCSIKVISIFFQAVGKPVKAAVVSLCRDIICFVPLVIILPIFMGVEGTLWAAPIADVIGIIVSASLVFSFFHNIPADDETEAIETSSIKKSKPGVIITIAREHGTAGKYIGSLVAKKLNIPYYDKELVALAAKDSGLAESFLNKMGTASDNFYNLYLSTEPAKLAIEAQNKIITKIAEAGSCVIVGRAADYVLKDNPNVIKVFMQANMAYRIKKVEEMYGDDEETAKKNIAKADKNRASYYKAISGSNWRDVSHYDLCIDSSVGPEESADLIVKYVSDRKKKDKND